MESSFIFVFSRSIFELMPQPLKYADLCLNSQTNNIHRWPSPRAQQVPCKTHSFADLMFFLLIPDVLLLVESFTLLQCTEHTTFITLCFVLQLCNSSRSLNYIYSLKTSKSVICLIRSVNLLPNQELPFWFVIMTNWFSCRCHSGWLYLNSSSKPSSTANWHAKCCL